MHVHGQTAHTAAGCIDSEYEHHFYYLGFYLHGDLNRLWGVSSSAPGFDTTGQLFTHYVRFEGSLAGKLFTEQTYQFVPYLYMGMDPTEMILDS